MASIARDKNGRRRIQFVLNGKRPAVRLGIISKTQAETVKGYVEDLVNARTTGRMASPKTIDWLLHDADPKLVKKLVKVGLVDGAERATALGPFIDEYVARRTDVKPATKEVWRQGRLGLVEHFGESKPLATINAGDADGYKLALMGQRRFAHRKPKEAAEKGATDKATDTLPVTLLSSMTVRKRLQFANMIFRAAVRHKLIRENPFADVAIKAGMPDRRRFISREEVDRLLAACSPTWKVIIALARYGGLRCPSEVLSLRWQDVDWARERINVRSPKTEHHPGKAQRAIPLFSELKPILLEASELAAPRTIYVVDADYRAAANGPAGWRNCNLRTEFQRIIERAGLKPWPRLFHNLRSSRQTELAESFPSHVVCSWLGNSEQIAAAHYLQTTDEHFQRASGPDPKAAQKAAQHTPRTGQHTSTEPEECGAVLAHAGDKADGKGFDDTRFSSDKTAVSEKSGAESGARVRESVENYTRSGCVSDDDGLGIINERWPRLSSETKRKLLSLALGDAEAAE